MRTPDERHAAVIEHLKRTAVDLSHVSLTEIEDRADWERQRPALYRELLYMLGMDPLPRRTPLRTEIAGVLERPGYRVEKVVFQSLPGLYVTGNLYLPSGASGPAPTLLYVCGHSPDPLGAKAHYQDRALWFVAHGYVCFVLDTLEFGEVAGIHHGIHDLNRWDWLARGYTPIGVEVWNAVRAIDYLETRREVDRRRIGMNGISGGGAATWYTAAVDARVAVAAPICSTITFGTQARHWRSAGQCDCIYFHNTFLRDFPLVAALIAPRPLLIGSGQRDGDFPPDGYHAVFHRAQRIYGFYGAAERIHEVDGDAGHADTPDILRETRRWMNHWLKGDATLPDTPLPATPSERPEDLACLKRLPADAVNFSIHQRFVPTAPRQRRDAATLRQALAERVFRWFPPDPAPFATVDFGHDGGWASRYADYRDVAFQSEPELFVRAQLLTPRQPSPDAPLLVYAKRPGDSIYFLDLDELLPVLGRVPVLIVNPRLTERDTGARDWADIERTATWVGRTIAGMQLWDIRRAVAWAREEAKIGAPVALYGRQEMGALGLYAALFDESIAHVILADPPASHRQGAPLLNVLRVTDLPEVAQALAPRRLTFMGDRAPRPFGAPGQTRTAPSLADALEVWRYGQP